MYFCKDCTAAIEGRSQRNPTHLVHSQHEAYAPATCPECGAKWFCVGDRMVLAGQRIEPKRALTVKPIPGTRRTSG